MKSGRVLATGRHRISNLGRRFSALRGKVPTPMQWCFAVQVRQIETPLLMDILTSLRLLSPSSLLSEHLDKFCLNRSECVAPVSENLIQICYGSVSYVITDVAPLHRHYVAIPVEASDVCSRAFV